MFNEKISIIIPYRDKVFYLKNCIESILKNSCNFEYEILLINNNSIENITLQYTNSLNSLHNIRLFDYVEPFNYSAINNFAVKNAKGKFILFLNSDVKVISKNWLGNMLYLFDDSEIGVVGAKLLYPNGTIQHAGIIFGKNIATHQFLKMKAEDLGEFNIVRQVEAVTGACMMTRKNLFIDLGGFDEINLPIAYNDVDYCLRLSENGFKIIWTPEVVLYHYESATRKSDISVYTKILNRKRYKQFKREQEYMRKRLIIH